MGVAWHAVFTVASNGGAQQGGGAAEEGGDPSAQSVYNSARCWARSAGSSVVDSVLVLPVVLVAGFSFNVAC